MGKVLAFIFFFVWLRGTLPRLRYDQFMHFGWKRLIPFTLVWIVAVAAIRTIDLNGGFDRTWLYAAIAVCVALIVVLMFVDEKKKSDADAEAEAAARVPFDAFAGGYPVPPMPGGGA
jgi:NADH-quinone oxidoreductase subunit H